MVWLRVTARGTVLKGLSSTKVENRYSRRDDIYCLSDDPRMWDREWDLALGWQ